MPKHFGRKPYRNNGRKAYGRTLISAKITPVSAEISLFQNEILKLFRPKDLISAKITLFWPK